LLLLPQPASARRTATTRRSGRIRIGGDSSRSVTTAPTN
jgi:hypothetical protein